MTNPSDKAPFPSTFDAPEQTEQSKDGSGSLPAYMTAPKPNSAMAQPDDLPARVREGELEASPAASSGLEGPFSDPAAEPSPGGSEETIPDDNQDPAEHAEGAGLEGDQDTPPDTSANQGSFTSSLSVSTLGAAITAAHSGAPMAVSSDGTITPSQDTDAATEAEWPSWALQAASEKTGPGKASGSPATEDPFPVLTEGPESAKLDATQPSAGMDARGTDPAAEPGIPPSRQSNEEGVAGPGPSSGEAASGSLSEDTVAASSPDASLPPEASLANNAASAAPGTVEDNLHPTAGGKKAKKPSGDKPGRPRQPAFSHSHPVLHVQQAMPPSLLSRLYAVPASLPILFLTLLLLAQVAFCLTSRALWAGGEVQLGTMFSEFLAHPGPLVSLNGEILPGTPPLYLWFLYGLYWLIGSQGPLLFFLAAALSALLYLWATLGLGRMVGRVDGRTNLAAGLMLLSSTFILGAVHWAGPGMLFAALILLSCIALYRAFVSPVPAVPAMVLAFALAACATLVNGPLGMLIPVCSITLFSLWRGQDDQLRAGLLCLGALAFGLLPALAGLPLFQLFGLLPGAESMPLTWSLGMLALPAVLLLVVMGLVPNLRMAAGIALLLLLAAFVLSGGAASFSWPLRYTLPLCVALIPVLLQATPQRLFRLDFFIGLAAGIALCALWLVVVYVVRGDLDFIINRMLQAELLEHGLGRMGASSLSHAARLPFLFLPWLLLLGFLPWGRLFSKSTRESLAASRTPAREGLAFLWSMVLTGLILFALSPGQPFTHLLPILSPLALLGARALLGLDGRRATWFRLTLAALLLVTGLLALLATLMLFGALPKPAFTGIPWTLPTSGVFFAASIVLMLTGIILWLALGSSRPEGILLVIGLSSAIAGYSLGGLSAPALDPVFSPKAQSLVLRAYADQGYSVASYGVEDGLYSYYSRTSVPALPGLEAAARFAKTGPSVVALPLSDLAGWEDKPDCLREVHRQWIGAMEYVALACPPLPDLAPAEDPFVESFDPFEQVRGLLHDFGVLEKKSESRPDPMPRQGVEAPVGRPGTVNPARDEADEVAPYQAPGRQEEEVSRPDRDIPENGDAIPPSHQGEAPLKPEETGQDRMPETRERSSGESDSTARDGMHPGREQEVPAGPDTQVLPDLPPLPAPSGESPEDDNPRQESPGPEIHEPEEREDRGPGQADPDQPDQADETELLAE